MSTISYAITASTEVEELPKLLSLLENSIREEDEIVLQLDKDNTDPLLRSLVKADFPTIKTITFPLNKHFGNFKNNLKDHCKKDYIFQIDADELPNEELIKLLPEILATYPDCGLFHVPRVNTVEGVTTRHLQEWNWTVNEQGWVNWPDWQPRLFKNLPEIEWDLPVHETIINFKTAAFFPESEEYCLYHAKSITKQESQNKFYSLLDHKREGYVWWSQK
mgnify:FL=1